MADFASALRVQARQQELYAQAATGLVADLEAAGFHIERLRELRRRDVGDARALPVLVKWLRRLPCSPLKRDVCYALGSRWARPGALGPLLDEYRRLYSRTDLCAAQTRAAICTTLERIADDSVFGDIVAIATDETRGAERGMAVVALGNMRQHRETSAETLLALLDEDDVAMFAILGLVKLDARHTIREVAFRTGHRNPIVRRVARRTVDCWRFDEPASAGSG